MMFFLTRRDGERVVSADHDHHWRTLGALGSFALRDPSAFLVLPSPQTVSVFLWSFDFFLLDDADILWW